MPMKVLLSAFALAALVAPGLALAQDGCNHAKSIKMTCADGTAWDEQTQRCAPTIGS